MQDYMNRLFLQKKLFLNSKLQGESAADLGECADQEDSEVDHRIRFLQGLQSRQKPLDSLHSKPDKSDSELLESAQQVISQDQQYQGTHVNQATGHTTLNDIQIQGNRDSRNYQHNENNQDNQYNQDNNLNLQEDPKSKNYQYNQHNREVNMTIENPGLTQLENLKGPSQSNVISAQPQLTEDYLKMKADQIHFVPVSVLKQNK